MRGESGVADERLTVSVEEAARLLDISRSLAYELCARGELPALRLGRRLVVPKRRLLAMVDEAEAQGAQGQPSPAA